MEFQIKNELFVKSSEVYDVKLIDAKAARVIVKKYHYSGKVVSNSKLHLGVFTTSRRIYKIRCFGRMPPIWPLYEW